MSNSFDNSEVKWDNIGERFFETGTDKCIVFPLSRGVYSNGVAWSGVSAVNESSDGAEATAIYADNQKYLNLISEEDLKLTVEAYDYPDEFAECIGETELSRGVIINQQKRKHFGFCFRTRFGNDIEGSDYGYKIHLIFDCLAAPSDRSHSTISDSPEAMSYSWEISTVPCEIDGYRPSAEMIFDSHEFCRKGLINVLRAIERVLYGSDANDSTFLKPTDVFDIFETEMFIRDSNNNIILDDTGARLQSSVYS